MADPNKSQAGAEVKSAEPQGGGEPLSQRLGCYTLVALCVWLVAGSLTSCGNLPTKKPDTTDQRRAGRLSRVLISWFGCTPMRMKVQYGGTADVFIQHRAYETLAFPDRDAFDDSVRDAYCFQLGPLPPAIVLRDLHTGDTLSRISCIWRLRRGDVADAALKNVVSASEVDACVSSGAFTRRRPLAEPSAQSANQDQP